MAARTLPTLERWFSIPKLANDLHAFLESPTGQTLLATLQYEFRAKPDNAPLVTGVDYMQVHAFRDASREGVQATIDAMNGMSVAREKKERVPDEGWATQPLRREDDPSPPVKSAKSKKK